MQKEIHPKYFPAAKVKCACGKTYTVGSTRETFEVEICSACHPFYSGSEKIIDTAGRVERFKARKAKAVEPKKKAKASAK
ncbi:MAG: 50S ribosomal protein L31 [Candidatus Pacebacteria bacterium]|nr:50S ribosomal protein L31 [Candidatus Paceibacterota bacterium]MDD5356604.1 50S ribosomal protein L31 [Candidatus Paceibacterota bacterium]